MYYLNRCFSREDESQHLTNAHHGVEKTEFKGGYEEIDRLCDVTRL